jgi:hypothetical protein
MCRVRKKAGRAGQERKEKDMFTMLTENTRRVTSAVAAVAVVAFAGLALDQGHAGSLPEGTVEVGEMTPVNLMQLAMVTLPEVVVTGERIEAGTGRARAGQPALLPGLAAAAGQAVLKGQKNQAPDSPSAASVLLK